MIEVSSQGHTEAATAHTRRMYLLAAEARPARTLLVGNPDSERSRAFDGWPGRIERIGIDRALGLELAGLASGYDLIVLDWVLDSLPFIRTAASSRTELSMLKALRPFLRMGGSIVGCTSRRLQLDGVGFGFSIGRHSTTSCRHLLQRAGYDTVTLYAAVPNGVHPHSIVHLGRTEANQHYGDVLADGREGLVTLGYLLRRLMMAAGMHRRLLGSLFFTGERSC